MPFPLEMIVYVHGVSSDLRGRDHRPEYRRLHEGVCARNAAWPTRFAGVEWGWNHDPGPPRSHQLLTDAQRHLGARMLHGVLAPRDLTVNPARSVVNAMRPLMIYGFSDMFYYVSQDGKAAVRNAVATQITEFVESETGGDPSPVSLTLVGHSAGSVICFDFLFFLFYSKLHAFIEKTAAAYPALKKLRDLAKAGRLRVRRLFTLGSPITMVACRSDSVLEILARGGGLDPKDYGLSSQWKGGPALTGPRWLNLWDRDDPIAWPVEALVQQNGDGPSVEDVYVDISDSVTMAHEMYWGSRKVHQVIAERW